MTWKEEWKPHNTLSALMADLQTDWLSGQMLSTQRRDAIVRLKIWWCSKKENEKRSFHRHIMKSLTCKYNVCNKDNKHTLLKFGIKALMDFSVWGRSGRVIRGWQPITFPEVMMNSSNFGNTRQPWAPLSYWLRIWKSKSWSLKSTGGYKKISKHFHLEISLWLKCH